MRKLVFVAACSGVLAACGGSSGGGFKDPDSVDFTYGASVEPADGSSEADAAGNLAEGLAGIADLQAQGAEDVAVAQDVALLTTQLGFSLFDAPLMGASALRSIQLSLSRQAASLLVGGVVGDSSPWDPACLTVSATEIRFDHCAATPSTGNPTVSISINGSMHRTAGHVYWDVDLGESMHGTSSEGAVSIDLADHLSGDVTFGAGSIVGFERSDVAMATESPSESFSMKVTFNVDLDLTYLADPSFCLTGGTLVAKGIWTERPAGATAADLPDQAVKFTWQENGGACSTAVLVAWGTPE
jgi:hypothetical protein